MTKEISPSKPVGQPSSLTAAASPPNPPAKDAHGFDRDAYDWIPVAKQRRTDGWTPQRQRGFIEALADLGTVSEAARSVGMSRVSCYRLRRSPGAKQFAAAWDAAIEQASKQLTDIAFERAINGVEEPVYNREGTHIYTKHRFNDRMLMFLIRTYRPDLFPPVSGERRMSAVQNAPPDAENPGGSMVTPRTLASAIENLEPAKPNEPEKQMDPQDFEKLLLNEREEERFIAAEQKAGAKSKTAENGASLV